MRSKLSTVLVLSAVAVAAWGVSAAQASPAWYECAKAVKTHGKYTGHYSDKDCSVGVESGGKYELRPGVGKGREFKGKFGKTGIVIVVPPGTNPEFPGGATIKLECADGREAGTPFNPDRVVKTVLELKKCKWGGTPCQSSSVKETIKTNDLAGELIAIEGGSGVGLELGPESGTSLAEFVCTSLMETNVLGSVIAEQTGDVNTISKQFDDGYIVGPGLGEVEYAPGGKFTPIVNIPTHQTGGYNGEHFLDAEISKEHKSEGTLPMGIEATIEAKGEPVEVKR